MALLQTQPVETKAGIPMPLMVLRNYALAIHGTGITTNSRASLSLGPLNLGIDDTSALYRSGSLEELSGAAQPYVLVLLNFSRPRTINAVAMQGTVYAPWEWIAYSSPGAVTEIYRTGLHHPQILKELPPFEEEGWDPIQGPDKETLDELLLRSEFPTAIFSPAPVVNVRSVLIRIDATPFAEESGSIFKHYKNVGGVEFDHVQVSHLHAGEATSDDRRGGFGDKVGRNPVDRSSVTRQVSGQARGTRRERYVPIQLKADHRDVPDSPTDHRRWLAYDDFWNSTEGGKLATVWTWLAPHDRIMWPIYYGAHRITQLSSRAEMVKHRAASTMTIEKRR